MTSTTRNRCRRNAGPDTEHVIIAAGGLEPSAAVRAVGGLSNPADPKPKRTRAVGTGWTIGASAPAMGGDPAARRALEPSWQAGPGRLGRLTLVRQSPRSGFANAVSGLFMGQGRASRRRGRWLKAAVC